MQITEKLKTERPKRLDFAVDMPCQIDKDYSFLPNILFSDEATFRQSGKVSRHKAHLGKS
jgi:hypothetical protein